MTNPDTASDLAKQKRYAEAGADARKRAVAMERRDPYSRYVYEAWGAAGTCMQLAGDHVAAMAAFDKCLGAFDRVLQGQANIQYMMNHVANWPEMFARAAFSALDAGLPEKALEYAEEGRARLVGTVIAAPPAPPSVNQDEWNAYIAAWRRLASRLSGQRVGSQSGEMAELMSDVHDRRRQLVASGVKADSLKLVCPIARAADVMARLKSQGAASPTVVYAVTLGDRDMRLVALSRNGIFEVPIPEDRQRLVLQAAICLKRGLAEDPGADTIDDELGAFLEAAGEPFADSLRQALQGNASGSIIWVPHGVLVCVPLGALPWQNGVLADMVSVRVASSLALACGALDSSRQEKARSAYVEGRSDAGDAATKGGETLFPMALGAQPQPNRPASMDELRVAMAGRTLALFSCHGVLRRLDPVASFLKLGFDCTVEQILAGNVVAPRSLLVLSTCNAGTVMQDAVNEPVGIPVALMASGGFAVVGPSQPVRSIAGVTFCLLFLRALGEGKPSPEAVQHATAEMRRLKRGELADLLLAAGHPYAGVIQSDLGRPAFRQRADWAFFTHWGGSWELERV